MKREEQIFEQALTLTSPEARAGYLLEGCAGDADLRRRVEELLAAHQDAGALEFLQCGDRTRKVEALLAENRLTEKPGDRIGRYKLLQQIGEGGCGVVYMAEQQEPVRRRVALKVIKLGMDTKAVIARFEAERQALALMDHPNIAQVFDAGATDTGRPYFVMELVRGIKITDYCDQNNLSTRERLDLFIQVCHAIQHAHQKGIIHRDIKPSNILVMMADDKPVPKVIDFGIAKATAQQTLTDKTLFTAFEQFIGTPAYMSPEQAGISGLDIDTRSDIYSLGVLFYELVTGRTPFDAQTLLAAGLEQMRRIIREQEPMRPSTRLRSLSAEELTTTARQRCVEPPKLIHQLRGDLDWIVMKCLEKDRTRRYETANSLAQDLERHLQHEPVVARPPSTAYRVQKFVRRNKVMVTAAGMVALALVLGIMASTWLALRERQQRKVALQAQAEEAKQRHAAQQARRQAEGEKLLARRQAYVADMNLAQQALDENNLGRALELLNRHRPAQPGEPDPRAWEWRYLWEKCRSDELAILGQHEGNVQSVAVSPDGKWVASGGFDGFLKIWALSAEAAGGRSVTNLQLGGSPVSGVAFSPDGRWLAAASWTNGFAVYQVPGWLPELTVTNAGPGLEPSLAFSADSRLLAVVWWLGSQGEVWNVETRTRLRILPCRKFNSGDPAVAWLPHSQKLAGFWSTNDLYQVSLFDVGATNRDAVSVIPLPFVPKRWHFPACVAVSPDAKQLAVGCWDSTIRIHAAEDGRQLRILTNHTAWVGSVAFSGDGQWLASACADHSTKVWRTHDWQETASLRGHLEEVWSVAFTPDGQRLVTGSKDGSVRLWPLAGSSRSAGEVSVNATGYLDLSGTCPAAVGPSNILTVWDGQTLEVRQRLSSYPIPDVLFGWPSPDGRVLLMGTTNGGVWLTGMPPDPAIPPVCLQTKGSDAVNVEFSDQANWVAISDRDRLQVWNLTNQPPYPKFTLATGKFWQVRFSPNERLLSAVTGPIPTERTVFVWDLASGEELVRFRPHRDNVSGIAFSPDNAVLATSSEDNTCKLLDLRRRQVTTLRGQRMALHSVCFSPDGDRLAAGSGDGSIIIWDLDTGREVLVLRKHLGEMNMVRAVRFHSNGVSMVSVHDNTAHLWRAPSWEEIAVEEGPDRM